ncbi:hypothetical protein [Nocardia gipuzkoensis]
MQTRPWCEQILLDKVFGKVASRPELDKALLVANREGDQLVVPTRSSAHSYLRL